MGTLTGRRADLLPLSALAIASMPVLTQSGDFLVAAAAVDAPAGVAGTTGTAVAAAVGAALASTQAAAAAAAEDAGDH